MLDSLTGQEDALRWLAAVSSTNAKCWVENPETVKEGGFMTSKSYITFRVLLKASDGELAACRHRFSDFEALRDNLRAKYFSYGLLVPSLPPKRLVVGGGDKEFLTERMQGLTLLCEELVSFPWFRKDAHWLTFMGSDSSSRLMSPSNYVRAGDGGLIEPEDVLTFMSNALPMPSLPLERLLEVKEEVVQYERKVRAVMESVKQVQAALKQLNTATSTLHTSLSTLQEGESSGATNRDAVGGDYLSGGATEMGSSGSDWSLHLEDFEQADTVTAAVTQLVEDKVTTLAPCPDYTSLLFHSFLEREAARCTSLRELFKYHADLSSSIDALTVTIEKLNTKKVQTEKIKSQASEAKIDLKEKQFLMESFYKGFFYFTLPLSVKNRAGNLRKMSECVAAYELIEGTRQQQAAAALFSAVGGSAVSAVTESRAMLDLLGVCPLRGVQGEEEVCGREEGRAGHTGDWVSQIFQRFTTSTSTAAASEDGDGLDEGLNVQEEDEVTTPDNGRVSTHSPPLMFDDHDGGDDGRAGVLVEAAVTLTLEESHTVVSDDADRDIVSDASGHLHSLTDSLAREKDRDVSGLFGE